MNNIYIFIIIILLFPCCKNKKTTEIEIDDLIKKELNSSNLPAGKYIVMFITEQGCSDCITKEFININQHEKLYDNLIILGAFSNKRHFYSSISTISFYRAFLLNLEIIQNNNIQNNIFYAVL